MFNIESSLGSVAADGAVLLLPRQVSQGGSATAEMFKSSR